MESSGLRLVLLGFTIDSATLDEVNAKSTVSATQTFNFSWAVVKALISANAHVSLISALPVPNYPHYPKWLISPMRLAIEGTTGNSIGFINLPVLKHITRFFGAVRALWSVHKSTDVILVHGVHSPFLAAAQFIRLINPRVHTCVILTDPPRRPNEASSAFESAMRALDIRIIRTLVKSFCGAIALTEDLGRLLRGANGFLVMEGILGSRSNKGPLSVAPRYYRQIDIAYAGGLYEEYGVCELIEAISSPGLEGVRLHLYGKGSLTDYISRDKNARVLYHGMLSLGDLIPRLQTMDLLINPRQPGQEFTKFSFPSKLIEYMSLGVPVASTRLEGIPDEYFGHLIPIEGSGVEGISEAIRRRILMTEAECKELADCAQQFVQSKKGTEAQGQRLHSYLSELVA